MSPHSNNKNNNSSARGVAKRRSFFGEKMCRSVVIGRLPKRTWIRRVCRVASRVPTHYPAGPGGGRGEEMTFLTPCTVLLLMKPSAFPSRLYTIYIIFYMFCVVREPVACIYIYIYLMFSSLARLSPVKSKTQKSIIYILYLLLTVYYIYIMYLRIPIILCGRLRLTLLQAVPSAAAAAAAPAAAAAAAAADAVAR